MTKTEWLSNIEAKKDLLREFIGAYHPASRRYNPASMPITARGPEAACAQVRDSIKKEGKNALLEWDKALINKDESALYSLLQGAWFGVPESTSCWGIPGFSEAVDLLDNPPEEAEEVVKEKAG